MKKEVIVIGGGAAGMETAGQIAKQGINVTLFEKEDSLGGNLRHWYHLFPNRRDGKQVIEYLNSRVDNKNLTIILNTTILSITRKENRFEVLANSGVSYFADAVVVTTGFDLFKGERKEEYGYGIYDNVVTSVDLERMFRHDRLQCSDGRKPQTVGFIHCVGSRDEKVGNNYCSKICCISAVKQAIEVREFLPDAKVFCFYMDIRMGGCGYEEMYRESQQLYGITFIRGKVSEVSESIDGRLMLKAEDTLVGRPLKMSTDMLVLMVGMEMSASGLALARNSGLALGDNRFFLPADQHFNSNGGNIEGIFYAGVCTAPMSVTDTISHARAAVDDVLDYLSV